MIRTVLVFWKGQQIARWEDVAIDPVKATLIGHAAGHALFVRDVHARLRDAKVAEQIIADVEVETIALLPTANSAAVQLKLYSRPEPILLQGQT